MNKSVLHEGDDRSDAIGTAGVIILPRSNSRECLAETHIQSVSGRAVGMSDAVEAETWLV